MRLLAALATPWRRAGEELIAAMRAVLERPGSEVLSIVSVVLLPVLAWLVYVPLHELLHACGCMAGGGRVSELEIAPVYGGALLARMFPFVKAGGAYAGRLSGFDTRGSDLAYLATDFAPFLLTIVFASVALRRAARRRSAWLLAGGAVLYVGVAVSLIGDYYEMGSILVSRAVAGALGPAAGERALELRHDDLALFVEEFSGRFPAHRPVWAGAAMASFLIGLSLATLTLAASQALGRHVVGYGHADGA